MASSSSSSPAEPCAATSKNKLAPIVKTHDWFNLIGIGLLNILNFYYLATGNGFDAFFYSTVVYFVLDMAFIGVWPASVKSPIVIMSHHIITSMYVLVPYYYPDYHKCMSYCMLVEINTWLLIARRNMKFKVFDILFYVSWVLLRNIWYPYLVYAFYMEWQHETKKCGSPWNAIMITPVFQLFLSGLNFYWTMPLVMRKLKQL